MLDHALFFVYIITSLVVTVLDIFVEIQSSTRAPCGNVNSYLEYWS